MGRRWTVTYCARCDRLKPESHWHYRADERGNPVPGSSYRPGTIEVVPAEHADALAEALEQLERQASRWYVFVLQAEAELYREGELREAVAQARSALTHYRQAIPASTGKESE